MCLTCINTIFEQYLICSIDFANIKTSTESMLQLITATNVVFVTGVEHTSNESHWNDIQSLSQIDESSRYYTTSI